MNKLLSAARFRLVLIVLALSMIFSVSCFCTGIAKATSFSKAKAGSVIPETEVDVFMQQTMERLHIPGAAVAIVRKDQVIYAKGYGQKDSSGTAVTSTTPFVIGSTSKAITATAVMQLVDSNQIKLNDPVQRYLPWFRLADEQASQQITIADLLHQTSGLTQYDGIAALTEGKGTIEQHVRSLQDVHTAAAPGSTFQYSNLNYNILGAVIEAASGQSYEDYIRTHVFEPLEMKHSYPSAVEAGQAGETFQGYQPVFGWMLPTKQLDHSGTVPSGYVLSSAEDMAHFLIAQMNQGYYNNKQLLSASGMAAMQKPAADMGGGSQYAMGWVTDGPVLSHNGATENSYSKMMIRDDYGVVVLTNSLDYLDSGSYEGIITGIDRIIHHQDAAPVGRSKVSSFIYTAINLFSVLLVLLLIWRIVHLPRRGVRVSNGKGRYVLRLILIVILQLLLPAALLWYATVLLAPWPVIWLFLPGTGHALFAGLILWIILGVLNIVWIWRHNRHSARRSRSYP
ncbi:serine hydrolase domain-containing protein [Paenibacillus wulumuqiensis]|uniref:serine hydrolase domain-containing protein n=1 Tax=Paenibacillus wulumuqiensis TaxID=1567107 RepID=UPI00069924DE|nr:serine hydrolase domain-containing protein [Paenibacillus wulumuqiensis]